MERRDSTELIVLRQEIGSLKLDLENLTKQVNELLQAWNAATGLLRVVKVFSLVGGSIATVWLAWKGVK